MAASTSIFELAVRQTLDSKNVFNVFHYAQSFTDALPAGIGHLADLANAVGQEMVTQIGSLQCDALTYVEVKAYELGPLIGMPLSGPPYTSYRAEIINGTSYVFAPATTGSIAGDYLPGHNAVKTGKRSLIPGKGYRGSAHFAGIPEASTTGNRISATPLISWTADADTLLKFTYASTVGGVTCNFFPVIYSPTRASRSHLIGGLPTGFAVSVNNTVTNAIIGTMKRRKIR